MSYLTEYDPDWPTQFREIADYLESALNDDRRDYLSIQHIGSTSVSGMVAKPIVDVDIIVRSQRMPFIIRALQTARYCHEGNKGLPGREAFRAVGVIARNLPQHHLYACEAGALELIKHLSFRDYLIAHPAEARRLSQLKRQLAFQQKLSREAYIQAKSKTVSKIAARALAWYEKQHSGLNIIQ